MEVRREDATRSPLLPFMPFAPVLSFEIDERSLLPTPLPFFPSPPLFLSPPPPRIVGKEMDVLFLFYS